ncbi:hypothetical protein MJG53_009582 [Ovis ammon polii x Ovis aries]|uniref:Uncharacterized protein n=2 Tax=Ovis TaxID=9935 RepID=A0A836CZ65_SHEEP|nr:hypothetical protein JEQ12_019450 [Ovis aries]KAI4582057.1 hypothetical protein MJG53_009582 [Ovis ammon polii x Ovis aries]
MSRIWLKKKSQSVDITAPGFNPLAGAGKQMPQASKPPAPKTPIIEEEQNNAANSQKHPSRRSELKRFYTIDSVKTSLRPAPLVAVFLLLADPLCEHEQNTFSMIADVEQMELTYLVEL